MSDPKPSAAEMVEVFLRMGKAGHYTTALLEDIVFAARAEAVAEYLRKQDEAAQAESDEDERVWAEIKATPLDVIEAELREAGCDTDNLTKQTRTVVRLSLERNKAMREKDAVMAVLRQLVAAMPRCESMACNCPNPATRYQPYEATCDDHGGGDDTSLAAPLRAALALLAEHKEGT